MANDADDEFVNSVMQDNGINWWEMDEGEWLRLQRDAGPFRSFEEECIALVTFRHMVNQESAACSTNHGRAGRASASHR